MKAMGFSETFSTALETSLLAEAATGQVELIGAELAVLPFIIFGRAMRNHHQNKKDKKEQEKEDQRIADQQAEEEKQREIDEQNRQREEEAKQQQQLIHDQNEAVIQQAVDAEYGEVENLEYEREERIEEFENDEVQVDNEERNAQEPWRMPNNLPDDDPNDPDDPNGGGDGPNGGDDSDDYIIMNPAGQPSRNQYQNPFWDMIGQASSRIAQQAINQSNQDKKQQEKMIADLPKEPTDQQKIEIDAAEQAHIDADQITQNQAIIQQQLLDVLTGLGEEELTLEQSLAELDKIENDLNKILGSQIKTNSIYASSINYF